MERRRDDEVVVNPRSSQQQVIRSVSVNNIAHHLESQVPDAEFEFDFFHQMCTISVEAVNGSFSGAQSMRGDSQVLHDPAEHDAQRGS